jgi:hypothetical protein
MSYVRVSIGGTLLGDEVWSVNPVFDPTGEFPGGVDQTALEAAAADIGAISPTAGQSQLMGVPVKLSTIRLEVRDDADDHLIGLAEHNMETPWGGGTPLRLPAQAAVVVSLLTDTPGGSGRGRMYWPALGATLDTTTARLATPTTDTVLTGFKTYLTAVRTALADNFPTIGFDLAVRSKTTHTTPHVTRLRVGNIIDTQRRRRDTLREAYVTTTFP